MRNVCKPANWSIPVLHARRSRLSRRLRRSRASSRRSPATPSQRWPTFGASSASCPTTLTCTKPPIGAEHRRKTSLTRFARGFGRDGEMRQLATWRAAAAYIREAQLRSIHDGALQALSRPGTEATSVVVAGIGACEAEEVARRLHLPASRYGDLIDAELDCREWATRCAPAVAVALLAAGN